MRPGENRGAWKECLALLPPGPDAVRTLPPPRPGDGTNEKRKPRRLAACRRGSAMEGASPLRCRQTCFLAGVSVLIPRRSEPAPRLPLMGEARTACSSQGQLGSTNPLRHAWRHCARGEREMARKQVRKRGSLCIALIAVLAALAGGPSAAAADL